MPNKPVIYPPKKQWTQPNNGNILGSLYSTRNIDLTVPGVLSLSKRMRYVGRDNGGANFADLNSIVFDGAGIVNTTPKYYLVTSANVYTLGVDLTSFAQDAISGTPTGNSDGVIWGTGLYVTFSNNLKRLVGGSWSANLNSLTANIPHPLCASIINNDLLVGNGNVLLKTALGDSGSYTTALTLPSNFQIEWIRSSAARTFIGCRSLDSTNTRIFEWDEVSPAATNAFEISANWALSGVFDGSDFYAVVNDGRLLKYNGGGFADEAYFPIYYALAGQWLTTSSVTNSVMHQRGMAMIKGRVHININGNIDSSAGKIYDNFLSGIWMYDKKIGLTHRYGISDSTTANADFAQMYYTAVAGALSPVFQNPASALSVDPTVGSLLLAGAYVRTTQSDGRNYSTIGSVTTGDNRGTFVLDRIESSAITNVALKLWAKFRNVYSATDKIIFKWRTAPRANLPFTTTVASSFTSTTTFTSTDTQFQYALVGDEVTITTEIGAGATAHISAIASNGGTYTVTLDEVITGAGTGDSAYMIVDNWTKCEISITSADTYGYKSIVIPQQDNSTWLQVKGELRGTGGVNGVTIEELQVLESEQIPVTS